MLVLAGLPLNHAAQSFPRPGGYAASCFTCGASTASGHATRTEALSALQHDTVESPKSLTLRAA